MGKYLLCFTYPHQSLYVGGGGGDYPNYVKNTLDYSNHMCWISFENSESFKNYGGGKASWHSHLYTVNHASLLILIIST